MNHASNVSQLLLYYSVGTICTTAILPRCCSIQGHCHDWFLFPLLTKILLLNETKKPSQPSSHHALKLSLTSDLKRSADLYAVYSCNDFPEGPYFLQSEEYISLVYTDFTYHLISMKHSSCFHFQLIQYILGLIKHFKTVS